MAVADRVRLHITPFRPNLLERYIPIPLKAQASNISFHTIETCPEQGFGYVELPSMEAQKLKVKLNGSKFQGVKVRIEEAKPEKKRKVVEENGEIEDSRRQKRAKKEKSQRENGVIPGYPLAEGRHVKRGWVEVAGTRKARRPEKDSKPNPGEGKKMCFKTKLPSNKLPVEGKAATDKKHTDNVEKERKRKDRKKSTVVKEFGKRRKIPGVDNPSDVNEVSSYEEGVGWVDKDGKVIEPERCSKSKRTRSTIEAVQVLRPEHQSVEEAAVATAEPQSEDEQQLLPPGSGQESSSDSDTSRRDHDVDHQLKKAKSNAERNTSVEQEQQVAVPINVTKESTPETKKIHPLEALYKRNAPKSEESTTSKPELATIDTSFSFFDEDLEDQDEAASDKVVPQTPRTKEDLEWRSQRSAAPTPDTAAIDKSFKFTLEHDDRVDEPETADLIDEFAFAKVDNLEHEESEFSKWFYEHRGDLNRAWKKRRREERKLARQRENRRIGRRIA